MKLMHDHEFILQNATNMVEIYFYFFFFENKIKSNKHIKL